MNILCIHYRERERDVTFAKITTWISYLQLPFWRDMSQPRVNENTVLLGGSSMRTWWYVLNNSHGDRFRPLTVRWFPFQTAYTFMAEIHGDLPSDHHVSTSPGGNSILQSTPTPVRTPTPFAGCQVQSRKPRTSLCVPFSNKPKNFHEGIPQALLGSSRKLVKSL